MKCKNFISVFSLDLDIPKIHLSKDAAGLQRGDFFEMKCNVSSVPLASYVWYRNKKIIGNTHKLIFQKLSIEDSGTYICETSSSMLRQVAYKTIIINGELLQW